MGSLNGQMLSAGLLEALVTVAEHGLRASVSGARIRQAGVTLGLILERQLLPTDTGADGASRQPTDATVYSTLAGELLEQLVPGSRVLDASADQVVACLPADDVAAGPPPREQLVAAVLGSIAGRQFGQATVRPELRLIDGETCWTLTVRFGPAAEQAPVEPAGLLIDEYRATDGDPLALDVDAADEPAAFASEAARRSASSEHEERMRLLGEMAAGVAHGLNNLLGAVAGQSSQLLDDPSASTPTRGLRLIHQAALDGAGLARRLLRVSRGEASEGPDALELVDLREVIADAVALTRPRWQDDATSKGVAIDLRVETPEPLAVLGVPSDLREIVVNLILNAVDAMPLGGRLLLRGEGQDRRAVLTCQDSGTGMDLAVLERAFEPFFSTKGSNGNGMGLAIVYSVVARHGGEVRVASAPGAGTTFTVILPLSDPAVFALATHPADLDPAAPVDDAATELEGLSLLLVDDDPGFRDVFARRLSLDAQRVDVVSDAGAALSALEDGAWDVLCIDERLPDMTGRQLAAEIRQRGREVVIVLISGFATQPNDPALLGPGVDAVLPKPCTDAELARVLRQIRRR
jgi:signal transduction histidine kinase/CheY-like chemotaxis protein